MRLWNCSDGVVLFAMFVFLHLVWPMLPFSLDCPFLIAHSVFSNVYLSYLLVKINNFSNSEFKLL